MSAQAEALYRDTLAWWADRVRGIPDGRWNDPTPCVAWTVRDLVNHVAAEDRWTVPLLHGRTIEEVGAQFDGDVLGEDPIAAALDAADCARDVVAEQLPHRETVHLSYGEERADEYLRQLAADHLVHAWDLAVATSGDTALPPSLVDEVGRWYVEREDAYRAAGLVAPSLSGGFDGSQESLLGGFGRRAAWGTDDAALTAFAAAFAAGDVDRIMTLMTDDCVFESTSPAPDGQRFEGAAAVREVWRQLFADTVGARFTTEDVHVCEGRGTLRWRFDWTGPDGAPGHVRGVDVVRLRGGKVCEKLSYVKG